MRKRIMELERKEEWREGELRKKNTVITGLKTEKGTTKEEIEKFMKEKNGSRRKGRRMFRTENKARGTKNNGKIKEGRRKSGNF